MSHAYEGNGSVTTIFLNQLQDAAKPVADGADTVPGWNSDG